MLVFVSSLALAQSVKLTPQQEAMLNQLPPAQRQQALEALRQFNQQGGGESDQTSISEQLSPLQEVPQTDLIPDEMAEEEPKAGPGSRLVINFTPREDLKQVEEQELASDAALDRLRGSHYFELDEAGVLALPGLPTIPLLALTQEAIEQRLGAEPSLKVFDIAVALIGVESAAAEALEPFGYDVFEAKTSTFQPVTTGPVPPD